MFCEAYNQSLTDAAAAGELSPALQRHLASCDSCRAAFADEQSLFAAIDSGLRAAANSEAPATLIPRVHVVLNNEPAPQPRAYRFSIWGGAGAAVTAATIFSLLYLPTRHPSISVESARTSLPPVVAPANPPAPSVVNSSHPGGVSPLQYGKRAAMAEIQPSAARFPEVVVAPEEGIALLRYEEILRRKSAAGIQTAAKSLEMPQAIEPLEIAELELGDLKIPVLSKPVLDGQAK